MTKSTKTSPLTDAEKNAVRLLLPSMTVAEVAEATKKAPEVINRYIAEMSLEAEQEAAKRSPEVARMIRETKAKLMSQAKATPDQAEQIVRKALMVLKRDPKSAEELWNKALGNLPSSVLMSSGVKGVTIGGAAASQKSDLARENFHAAPKLSQPHIYGIDGKPRG